ncbi:MAG: hypothetical protein IPN91_04970 [Holophagaceae bacterium]|uniref:Alginate export domain-containing protein n=1 Tax=Candidatus Geothrix odensensis TaxID=2954440 RepID=A0A936F1C4_9BACT|nr:hypothetical protein [Candidatus Geothrix odensensis]
MPEPRALRGLACALGAAPALVAQAPPPVEVEFLTPPAPGGPLVVQAKAPPGTEWVVLFHRRAGETEFETLTLARGEDGLFTARAEAVLPTGVPIQCYVASKGAGGVSTLPAEAPTAFFNLNLPASAEPEPAAAAAAPPPPPPKPHGPIYVDGSATDLIHRKVAVPDEPTLLAAGQVRLVLQKDEEDRHLAFGARLVYSNQPLPNQARWTIGDIQATYAAGAHRLQAGDLMTQESEFTLGPGGRRGLDYIYSGQPTAAHLFALNTQRQAGLTGLLWPVEGSEAYGGSLSRLWFGNTLRTRLVFLSGRDDLATAANLVTAFALPVREGSTGALVVDGRFLESRLAVSGEYARSLFTPDALVGTPMESDQAWRLATQWTDGGFSAQAGYRAVGQAFGTVGVAFFTGDRRVFDSSVALNRPTWGLSATATDERTNPTGRVNLSQAWNQSQSLDARVVLNPTATWRVGLRAGRQAAEVVANPFIPFSNSERTGVVTGFDLVLPPQVVLTFNAQFDQLQSTGYTRSTGSSKALSLGGNLGLGTWGRLSPNLSWSRILSQPGDQQTTIANAFLNAQFSLIPGTLQLLLNGGASRTVLSTGTTLNAATAEGTLGLTLDPYLRNLARGSLGLKARYTRNPDFLGIVEDNRLFLLLNLSY